MRSRFQHPWHSGTRTQSRGPTAKCGDVVDWTDTPRQPSGSTGSDQSELTLLRLSASCSEPPSYRNNHVGAFRSYSAETASVVSPELRNGRRPLGVEDDRGNEVEGLKEAIVELLATVTRSLLKKGPCQLLTTEHAYAELLV